MIPLAVPNLSEKEKENLIKCVESTFVSTVGPFVNEFEEKIKTATKASSTVCVNTGTAALHAGLTALGVMRDDLVILPSLTFIASANAIAYTGASPWLIDVSNESWTLDPVKLEHALRSQTKTVDEQLIHISTGRKVSAIMPVYTLGCPADMDRINKIAEDFNLPVICDGAAAIGAKYKEREIGEIANLTTLSFNGNKTITSGGGGALIGNDEGLISKIKHLTTTARKGPEYYHDEVGFNYRMTNIEAAVGCAQIDRLNEFVNIKRRISALYSQELGTLPGCSIFPTPDFAESACWFSGVVLDDLSAEKVIKIRNHLNQNGVMARPFWMPIHLQPKFSLVPKSDLCFSENLWKKILVLPCSTGIKESELSFVIDQVRKTFQRL